MSNRAYSRSTMNLKMPHLNMDRQRKLFIGIILLLALLAFELFNFDTTQFALQSLLGDVKFLGIMWATILAIAFCSIDFAGLMRLFTPEHSSGVNKGAWYLMGAWLLGATMNAVMTWWAVSVTLLNNNFGNEVLSREELLRYVPIFVAVLVWLTRILFIGAFSVAGAQLFQSTSARSSRAKKQATKGSPTGGSSGRRRQASPARLKAAPKPTSKSSQTESYSASESPVPMASQPAPPPPQAAEQQPYSPTNSAATSNKRTSRVRQRPPVPNGGLRKQGSRIQARPQN